MRSIPISAVSAQIVANSWRFLAATAIYARSLRRLWRTSTALAAIAVILFAQPVKTRELILDCTTFAVHIEPATGIAHVSGGAFAPRARLHAVVDPTFIIIPITEHETMRIDRGTMTYSVRRQHGLTADETGYRASHSRKLLTIAGMLIFSTGKLITIPSLRCIFSVAMAARIPG